MQLHELIDILVAEGRSSQDELLAHADLLATLDESDAPEGMLDDAAGAYADFCRRASAAAESLGLDGLTQLASTLADGMDMAGGLPLDMRAPASALLKHWPHFFIVYLESWLQGQLDETAVSDLLVAMADAQFITPLDEQQLLTLGALLMSPPSLEAQASALMAPFEPLPPEALLLDIPADAERSLVDGFLTEGPELIAQVTEVALQLGRQRASAQQLDLAHRSAHTLKGTAAIVGVRGIVTVAHALEDVMEAYRREDFEAPPGLHAVVMAACDQLDVALEHLSRHTPLSADFAPVAHALHAWAGYLQGQNVPEEALQWMPVGGAVQPEPAMAALQPTAQLTAAAPTAVAAPEPVSPFASTRFFSAEPVAQPEANPHLVEEEVQVRIPAKVLDQVFRALNELSVGLLRLRTECDDVFNLSTATAALEQVAMQRVQEIERRITLDGLGQVRADAGNSHYASSAHHVPMQSGGDFDALELDRYTELTGLTQAMYEAVGDLRVSREELTPALRELGTQAQRQLRFAREAQYQVARARLHPLSDLRARMRRTVRQTCAAVGHEAELEIVGDDLRVDAAVIGPLSDALLHLLRNSVDHGIESPQERKVRGKPPVGSIRVAFTSHGGGVVVRISDDGRGLNHRAILNKAIENGLVAPDVSLSPDQIARLIFLPGFSTRDAVTETSGRGVGLDVVAQVVASLQGHVSVQSTPAGGTEFRVFVLASIGTVHALHVQVDGESFLIPSPQLVRAESAATTPTPEATADAALPEIWLADLLHGQRTEAERAVTDPSRPALILEVDGVVRRVTVDRIVEAREFLISPSPTLLGRLGGVSGVGVLADGSLGLVLDLVDLSRQPLPVRPQGLRQMQAALQQQAQVLVVDDSTSVRNTLSALLRDADYRVTTARDGLEAIQALKDQHFSLVMTDLEMPRLNGFELTEFIRQRSSQPDVPVIMLTSRGQDKHRTRAEQVGVTAFLMKPYSDQDLVSMVRNLLVPPLAAEVVTAQPVNEIVEVL